MMNSSKSVSEEEKAEESGMDDFQALFGSLFRALPGAVLVWGRSGKVAAVNANWESAFGYRQEEVLDTDSDELNQRILGVVAEPDFVRQVLKGARENPGAHPPAICHILPLDGRSERYLECRVEHVDGGLLDGYMIEHYQDIDQRVRSEQEQHTLQKTLIQAQKLEIVGTMAAGIFHDLNNVLAIVSGYSQMIRVNPAAAEKYIRKISDSCGLMERIIQQAMAFATSGRGDSLECDLSSIVEDSLALLRHCVPKRIELHWEEPECETKIRGNATQLFQLMMNLCLNASQAIDDKGNIDVTMIGVEFDEPDEARRVQAGRYIRLDVSDTGCGMGEKTHNRLFNPFFSKQNHREGRGLGMYVVQQILSLHDAGVEVYSQPGQGTKISVYFPVYECAVAEEDSAEEE